MPTTPPSGQNPLPIQYTPVTKEQLASDDGVAFLNQQLSQFTTTINALVGAGGPTLLPGGVDVQGARVTGLSAPTSPADAVSLAHANANYGPATQSTALDIGGTHTLKGLSYLLLKQQQSLAVAQGTYTGAHNYFTVYGLTFQWGKTSTFDTGPETETFPIAFPNACLWVGLTGDFGSNANSRIWSAENLTTTSFLARNDGLQAAWWLAVGW